MKYIREKDDEWHDCKTEMPSTTTDAGFLDNNIIKRGDLRLIHKK